MRCCYDEKAICDRRCTAFEEFHEGIYSSPHWDTTAPIPHYIFKTDTVLTGHWCRRGDMWLEEITDLKVLQKDGEEVKDV